MKTNCLIKKTYIIKHKTYAGTDTHTHNTMNKCSNFLGNN